MGARRYYRIIQFDEDDIGYIYEKETNRSFYDLKIEVIRLYREGYLRRKTDGPYFMRKCMNEDFIACNSNVRVC